MTQCASGDAQREWLGYHPAMSRFLSFLFLCTASLAAGAAAAGDIFYRQDPGQSVVISNVPESEGFTLLIAAPPPDTLPAALPSSADPQLRAALMDRARSYVPWVEEAARASKVDARLLHAVIAAESGYNPAALSPKGAVGMMQLLPATARRYGVANSYDAQQNIQGGARYLADLLRMFHNDTRLALAAYNAGENAVWRYGAKVPPYRETEAYVPRVLDFYRKFVTALL